jgi:hypothetical protein
VVEQHRVALEQRLEQHQQVLDHTMSSLETSQLAAQEAHDTLFRVEAEAAYAEGMAARKDADLRTELLSMRSEYNRERERLRTEGRRMQNSLKEMQARVKAEVQARSAANAQVESLKEQLIAARTDVQRRGKEGQEARGAFVTLEKRLEQYTELFTWVSARCTEALGEDALHELRSGGASTVDTVDGLKRVVSRTLTLLQRRTGTDTGSEKENIGNVIRPPRPKKVQVGTSEAAQRLAVVQGELLNYEVQNEELISRQRSLQERLSESEEAMESSVSKGPGLRTEQRGRLRAAEEGQKKSAVKLAHVQDELQWQYTRHEEEHERLRARLSSLQRAKEAGERYIEAEENAWLNAQRQEQALHSEYTRMRTEIHDAEANARDACTDAVEARAASQIASTAKRRLEAELEEMQATKSMPTSARRDTQDQSASLPGPVHSESGDVVNLRSELAALHEEASSLCRRSQELEQETELSRHRFSLQEQSASEWRAAAGHTQNEYAELRRALDEQVQASHLMEQQFKNAIECQQAQQAKIDEAKRTMVSNAMEQQEHTFKHELAMVEAAANSRCEEAVRELQRCADEHQEQMLQLDHSRKSMEFYQQRANTFEVELQQQTQDLTLQEQRICDFGRAELMAMTAEQEAQLQAHVDASSSEKNEQMIAEAVLSAKAKHDEDVAHLRGNHAVALATLHGEYSGELAAMRRLELTNRDELAAARLSCEAAEAVGEETAGDNLRQELRKELFETWRSEHWAESYSNARQEILEEIHENPGCVLRRELREQDLLTSKGGPKFASPVRANGSPASSSSGSRRKSHRQSCAHSTAASGNGVGTYASPSSIGACSTLVSSPSPACASSALLLAAESSSSWADCVEQQIQDHASATLPQEPDLVWGSDGVQMEETIYGRRPRSVASAPASRQSSATFPDRNSGVFRQSTEPLGAVPSWSQMDKVEGTLPPPPPQLTGLDTTFGALPPPPGSYQVAAAAPAGPTAFKAFSALPPPPLHAPRASSATSFQDQAMEVLEMVSRSRAPFRSTGFTRQGRSFGQLPAWPAPS